MFPLILQAHMFHIVNHHTITTPFLVTLNERESRGRGEQTVRFVCFTNYLTARFFVKNLTSLTSFHSCLATLFSTRTEYRETPVQKLQLFRYPSPQNPSSNDFEPTMALPPTPLHQPSHVSTNLTIAVVYRVMRSTMCTKKLWDRYSILGDVQATKIHHHYPCNEVFNAHILPAQNELTRVNLRLTLTFTGSS